MGGIELIQQIANIFAIQNIKTEILAAAIQSSLHIIKCAEARADIGLAKFMEDAKKFA